MKHLLRGISYLFIVLIVCNTLVWLHNLITTGFTPATFLSYARNFLIFTTIAVAAHFAHQVYTPYEPPHTKE